MHKQLLFLFILLQCGMMKAQDIFMPLSPAIEAGSETYVFGDTLLVRSETSVRSAVVDTLYAGMLVTIRNKEKTLLHLKGFSAPWVAVRYTKNGQEANGYVWSGLLSFKPLRRAATKYLYGVTKAYKTDTLVQNEKHTVARFQIGVKVVADGQVLSSDLFTVDSESAAFADAYLTKSRGLSGTENILSLQFGGEACGVPTYTHHFAWTGLKLVKLLVSEDISDAGVFYHTEEMVLPHNAGGKPNYIILRIEEGESTEKLDKNGDLIYKKKQQIKSFSWTGSELVAARN